MKYKYKIELTYFANANDNFAFPKEIEAESELQVKTQLEAFFVEQADLLSDNELLALQGLAKNGSLVDALTLFVAERMNKLTISKLEDEVQA